MPQITLANGKRFHAELGEILLNAALRSSIVLEHSCKTGRCSSCKVLLQSGLTETLADETSLEQAELNAGWILSCARSATTDVHLDFEDIGDFHLYPVKTIPCRVQSLQKLNGRVLRLI